MKIAPHQQKTTLNVVVIEGEEIVRIDELIQLARKNNAIEQSERGSDAFIWIQCEGATPSPSRLGYLWKCAASKAVITAKEWIHIPEGIQVN